MFSLVYHPYYLLLCLSFKWNWRLLIIKVNLSIFFLKNHPSFQEDDSSSLRKKIDSDEDEDIQEDYGINTWHHLHNEPERRQTHLIFLYKELVLLSKALKRDEMLFTHRYKILNFRPYNTVVYPYICTAFFLQIKSELL